MLPNDGNLTVSPANFGFQPYGTLLSGNLFYDPQNADGCQITNNASFALFRKAAPLGEAVFLVKRGNCTFEQKDRIAKIAGAVYLLIADSKDEDISHVIMTLPKGSRDDVNIGSALLKKSEADHLLNYLSGNMLTGHKLNVTIYFSIEKKAQIPTLVNFISLVNR